MFFSSFLLLSFGSVYSTLQDVLNWVEDVVDDLNGIFADVDFSILYDWLPSDVQGVCLAVLAVLIFLALIGLLKKAILFFG